MYRGLPKLGSGSPVPPSGLKPPCTTLTTEETCRHSEGGGFNRGGLGAYFLPHTATLVSLSPAAFSSSHYGFKKNKTYFYIYLWTWATRYQKPGSPICGLVRITSYRSHPARGGPLAPASPLRTMTPCQGCNHRATVLGGPGRTAASRTPVRGRGRSGHYKAANNTARKCHTARVLPQGMDIKETLKWCWSTSCAPTRRSENIQKLARSFGSTQG